MAARNEGAWFLWSMGDGAQNAPADGASRNIKKRDDNRALNAAIRGCRPGGAGGEVAHSRGSRWWGSMGW